MKINHFLAGAGFLALALIIGHSVSAADLRGSLKDSYTDIVDDAPKGWTGPYIGIGAGIGAQDVEESHVEVYDYKTAKRLGRRSGVVTTTENKNDWLLTGRFGYDRQSGPFIWGPFAEITYFGGGGNADFGGALGGRLGWLLTPEWLAYFNGGVEFLNGSASDDASPFIGGGFEWKLRQDWNLALEIRDTFADGSDSLISVDDLITGRIMLVRRF